MACKRALRRRDRGARERAAGRVGCEAGRLRASDPDLTAEIDATQRRALPEGWDDDIPDFDSDEKGLATRKASNQVENAIAAHPWLLAAPPTSPTRPRSGSTSTAPRLRARAYDGRQLHTGSASTSRRRSRTGSRSQAAALWSTYLTFSDYARPAIRLSALMELPVIHVFTHDSIGLGEDGPTHQPVEQLASLRAIPGLDVIRPADANEVAEAWPVAIDRTHQPVALVLTRQNVPILDRSQVHLGRGPAPRRLCPRRPRRRRPRGHPDRDRQRGRVGPCGP